MNYKSQFLVYILLSSLILLNQQVIGACNRGCTSCSVIDSNCSSCIGSNRILPTCECDVGYYDDGINNDCQPCDYKCAQCSYQPDEFPVLMNVGSGPTYKTSLTHMPSELDNFGKTGTVYKVQGLMRFGTEASNSNKTVNPGGKYQFCVWIKLGSPAPTVFEFDIVDRANRRYITDEYGTIIKMNPSNLLSELSSSSWTRICVSALHNNSSNYRFMDLGGKYGTTETYYYANPQLMQVFSQDAQPLPYIAKKSQDGTCQFCSHYTRVGSECDCSPGYYEVTPGSNECHSPKPSECDYYIRLESAGWLPNSPLTSSSHADVYLNDVKLGTDAQRGYNLYVLDSNFSLEDQASFDVYGNASKVTEMITYIDNIATGKIVLVVAKDEASGNMTTSAYQALQSLGMNENIKMEFRDSLAIIGRKGAAPGTVKQVIGKQINKGTANLVGCLQCSPSCFQCMDVFDQFPIMKNQHTYQVPQINSSITDFQGNTGTVYEVVHSGMSKIRFGKFTQYDQPLDQIIKGMIYQFSVWVKKKSGSVNDSNFELDIVDRYHRRYITDENGSIIRILTNSQQPIESDVITENWQRLVVNAKHDNAEQYHFIDLGSVNNFEFYFSHPQLFEIPDINYPPIRHVNPNNPQNGCYKCLHFARQPNDCLCSTGYSETVSGETECSAPIPNTCSKFVRIESAGTNYAEYDPGDYLRMYMNDVSLGTFSSGITLVIMNQNTFAIESTKNYAANNSSFDPTQMITDINSITNGRYVLVGIKDDGSQNLSAATYTALQSLGLNSSTTINYRDGLAMIGVKGASAGSVTQQHSIMLKGSKANVVQCLQGCDYQCSTCSNQSYNCDSCSHTTRDINDSCNCKPTFYNNNTDVECKSCVSPCVNCTSALDCSSCNDGYYLSSQRCLVCDNTVCGTCTTNATTCIKDCNSDCKTCDTDGTCLSCDDGKYLNSGSCQPCDNTTCATCNTNATTCNLSCGSTCATCDVSADCLSCVDGKYVHTDGTCKNCDNTVCGTCSSNSTTCVKACNSDCKTCDTDGTCLSCDDGKFLNSGSCQPCDNTTCATCNTNATTCNLSCGSTCATCDVSADCLSCVDGKYVHTDGTCQNCDNSVCGTCSSNAITCVKACNSDCKTCDTDGTCLSCEDGKFLNSGSCQTCDNTTCATCNTNATNCVLSCGSTCATCDVQGNCLSCEDGKYLDSATKTCKLCDNTKCATCQTNSQNCILDCNSDCKTCQVDGTCSDCELGKWLNSDQCDLCDNTVCATCNTSATDCQTNCGLTCLTCDIDASCLTCVDGKFLDTNKTCQLCDDSVCGTCNTNSTTCIIQCGNTCKTCNTNGNCKTCEDGFYLNGNVCSPCDHSVCGTCNSSNTDCIISCDSTCLTCDITGECVSCNSSYFVDSQNSNTCQQCDYTCKECQTNSNNCTECSHSTRDENSNCGCSEGYYDTSTVSVKNQACEMCDIKCKACQNQADECTECIDDSRSNPPNCNCSDGFYTDLGNGDCLKCKFNCKCTEFQICTECLQDDNDLRELPSCTCIMGYYQDNSTNKCQKCSPQCSHCSGSTDNCLICSNSQLQIPNCECKENQYEEIVTNDSGEQQQMCIDCPNPSKCSRCSSATVCIECSNPNFNIPDCEPQNTNYQSFSLKVDSENLEQVDQKCEIQCESCEQHKSNCTECKIGINRSQQIPNCSCLAGYHDNDGKQIDCQACISTCRTCQNVQQCTSCYSEQSRVLNKMTLQCECQKGFTESETNICVPCYFYYGKCFQSCPSNTIQIESNKTCQELVLNTQSNSILVYVIGSLTIFISVALIVVLQRCMSNKFKQIKNKNFLKLNQQDRGSTPPKSTSDSDDSDQINNMV